MTKMIAGFYRIGEEHVSLLTYPEIRDRLIPLNGWTKTCAMTGWRMAAFLAER